jgi:hypothetical protein
MGAEINIGSVFSRGFELLGRNWPAFGVFALLLVAAPNALSLAYDPAAETLATTTLLGGYLAASILPPLLFGLLYQVIVNALCLQQVASREADLAAALATAFKLFLPILAAAVMKWMIVILGMVALIVPGVIAYCMLAVVVPTMIAEGVGPVAALKRSRELTELNRMTIFGTFFLIGAGQAMAAVILAMIVAAAGAGPIGETLVTAIVAAATALVEAPVTAALYVELRTLKEGGLTDGLVEVFE